MKRIVVTGMGVVSPLGTGVELAWKHLLEGKSGISTLPDILAEGSPVNIAGWVKPLETDPVFGLDLSQHISAKELRRIDRFIQFALIAAEEAIHQAQWHPKNDAESERTATIIASGIGGFPAIAQAVRKGEQEGVERLSPFTIPSFLVNLAAGQVALKHQFKGPLGAPVTACAAGVQAIGDAARLIHANEADIVICGGAEACIDKVSLGGFAAAKALSSRYADTPEQASRPFDQDRDGFVMGEGAGILVIESYEHAMARGATPIAELVGYGTTSDAYHITSSPEDGSGAARAMSIALNQAGLTPAAIDHINAHATSTPVGDAGELAAIKRVFGTQDAPVISATKSSTGHLLGAAGGLEAIFTIKAIQTQYCPPTINLEKADERASGLTIVGQQPLVKNIDYALSNGFGFGGVNASVIFKRFYF
ncbi:MULTISPECIES: beta-ketoacyl-ACP synthase II [unclassified Methylophilus]|uniref:beta-ketoacyl-ACP synthase II n=1 Tax=unclassified Methylophilus TaxID=2630143 RepID=UPI0006F2F38A|nr:MULTISPECIES: beta-ketoacyl-ACP synthase II [unclassified Methylophilus]KQT41743.1 3-oxoacyl-ACP synthase [Methylophilus sp. Leaf416]KQT55910.1 3-oxoacyl-ACP synthase [Methylophilus sp. Leaf459]